LSRCSSSTDAHWIQGFCKANNLICMSSLSPIKAKCCCELAVYHWLALFHRQHA
jgi:hypothetical protein